ncbi:MAG: hypothetical protein ACJAVV_003379 [Alphaproteobacteria bacterium]|jgi:hypothetical protein
MKLLTIALTLTLSATSLSSMANKIVFKPVNGNIETQACLLAATQGLKAAKIMVKKERVNFNRFKLAVSCNGLSLTEFANKYQPQIAQEVDPQSKPIITLVAKNNESMVCLDALVVGEDKARKQHNVGDDSITCNDQNLKTFLRKYQKENFIVRNSAQ